MEYKGKLYGKVGNGYFPLITTSEEVDYKDELLNKALSLLGQMRRSITVHPDCEEDSEFEGYADSAQELENEITEHLKSEL